MKFIQHGHSPEEITQRLNQQKNSYLRDWIYGGVDGAVTTFAVVAGVMGAHLSPTIVVVLGLANLLGDGFSMAASNFLGTKTEEERYRYYAAFEEAQTQREPQGETEEIRQIYLQKGFTGEHLEKTVSHIVNNKKLWVDTMMQEEYGLSSEARSALKAAISTFIAFALCGFLPLLPFVFRLPQPFFLACFLTGCTFFLIGSIKSKWSIREWWICGLETFLIGSVAASIAYFIGLLFR